MLAALNILYVSTLLLSLLSVVILLGIVWRVEQLLDISYKFMLAAMIVFSVNLIVDLLQINHLAVSSNWQHLLKALFIIFFILGVLEMRVLLRRMDGELRGRAKKPKG